MSRHRDVRNLDANDYDDDFDSYGSSYGSSYQDETSLSSSMDKYMYRRGSGQGSSGHTPKMGHFLFNRSDSVPSVPEEDEDGPPGMRPRSDSETSSEEAISLESTCRLSSEEREKLAACLDKVLDIVGDTLEEQNVRDTIIRCDYDAEVAVNTLLNHPVKVSSSKKVSERRAARRRTQIEEVEDVEMTPPATATEAPAASTATTATGGGNGGAIPLPTSAPQPIQSNGARPKIPIEQLKVVPAAINIPVSSTTTPSAARVAQVPTAAAKLPPSSSSKNLLKLQSNHARAASPAGVPTPSKSHVAMRKTKVNALQEFSKERGQAKPRLNLVVVGHVDSGKSTLMGHLLYDLGSVTKKLMHKYESESRKIGKQSFAYAWVLDETEEERDRGITMDVGQSMFETPKRSITLLDAPGHKDFIPNMISGAYQADVAILVVNATRGEFEAGFDSGGQTREHALLVRSLGVSQLTVVVNKMDTVDWRQERFEEIRKKLGSFLKTVGFKEGDVNYVPCSGFTGDNLVKTSPNFPWHEGGTLVEAIDGFKPPQRLIEKAFRMSVSDVFKAQSSNGFTVAGRIESGFVQKDDKALILPLNEIVQVKNLYVDEMSRSSAFAGDHVSLIVTGAEQTNVAPGMVICDPTAPIPVTKRFRARVVIFNVDMPIIKGFPVVFHYGSVQCQAVIKKLISEVNKSTGEVTLKKPRCLLKNCNAIVEIVTDSPVCLELYSDIKELGRFMLRNSGKTIAAGLVTEILSV